MPGQQWREGVSTDTVVHPEIQHVVLSVIKWWISGTITGHLCFV